jgi:hypothetical protein
MSVNPNLATLMGLIDELQEQMPEGKYLEAMNALRDLHGIVPIPRPPPPPPVAFRLPEGGVRLTDRETSLRIRLSREIEQANERLPRIVTCLRNPDLWGIVCKDWNKEQTPKIEEIRLPTTWGHWTRGSESSLVPRIESWWMTRGEEHKKYLIQKTLEIRYERVKKDYEENKNPDLAVCPFVSRHAIGKWENPSTNPRAKWNCVCGSVNILVKNWRQHEVCEKHVKWHEAGRGIEEGKLKTMMDNTCCTWDTRPAGRSALEPSALYKYHKKGMFKHITIAFGVIYDYGTYPDIAGNYMVWRQPSKTYKQQSLNEWLCGDLKGKPWDFVADPARYMPTITEPTHYSVKSDHTAYVDLSQKEAPPYRAEPPRPIESWCPVERRHISWMPEEQYAMFVTMDGYVPEPNPNAIEVD